MLRVVLQESEGQQLPMGEQPWLWLTHHQGHKEVIESEEGDLLNFITVKGTKRSSVPQVNVCQPDMRFMF